MHWILLQAQGQDLFVYLPIPEKAQTSVTWVELVSLLIAPCNIKKEVVKGSQLHKVIISLQIISLISFPLSQARLQSGFLSLKTCERV